MRSATLLADVKSRFFFVVLSLSLNIGGFLGANAFAQNTFPATGKVGIGTQSPVSQLDISGSGNQVITIQSTTAAYPGLNFANLGFDYTNQLDANNGSLYWYNGSTRNLTLLQNGNVGIGTAIPASKLDVSGILHISGLATPPTLSQGAYLGWNASNGQGETDFINNQGLGVGGWYFISVPNAGSPETKVLKISPGGAITFADGTVQATAWNGTLCGGDYAESVDATGGRALLEPGDVMVVDSESPGGFLKSTEPYSTMVAGIYSTKPGVVGRRSSDPDKVKDQIPMAMVGIVPAKVSAENGAVRPGDLLVTSSTPGYVMKGSDRERMMGAIVGKALGKLDSGTGIIQVLVSLQ